jgi:hypothetical protein
LKEIYFEQQHGDHNLKEQTGPNKAPGYAIAILTEQNRQSDKHHK